MKKAVFILSLFILHFSSDGQKLVDTLTSSSSLKNENKFWYYFPDSQDQKLALKDLIYSDDSLNIRIRSYSWIIDISFKKVGK